MSISLVHADPDFYAPLGRTTRRGTEYAASGLPSDWTEHHQDVWTAWYPPQKLGGVTDGWKIHLSARADRAQHVLDVAAPIFAAHGVGFKHLSCSLYFVVTHHKHAERSQSGKFCAAYPPDAATAEALMRDLAAAFDGEEGPFVLSDRRFGDSRVVHYRYGAFVARRRLTAQGGHELLVLDAAGRSVPDVRGTRFSTPEGITDPFLVSSVDAPARSGAPEFGGVRFDKALRHSNGGGAYRGTDVETGRTVFVKESRGHHGLVSPTSASQDRLRNEYQVLRELHRVGSGFAPEPLRYFRHLENEFLVTEFVPGRSLRSWWVEHNPIIWSTASDADFESYYARALKIVDELTAQLERLHGFGYAFIDLSPDNVLVDFDDSVRLIDFETAARLGGPLTPIGTPGFFPAEPLAFADDPVRYDDYALSSIALALIAPINTTADLNHGVLTHLKAQLDPRGLVPQRLWELATRVRRATGETSACLQGLYDGLVAGLRSTEHPDGVVPLGPRSYATNELGFGHGLAGVVHALHVAGAPSGELLDRLRTRALAKADDLPPGLLAGQAGIARVLAEHGEIAAAQELLARADDHPLLHGSATLGFGSAGVGLAHLALHRHTGDSAHLDRARRHAEGIPHGAALIERLGWSNAVGLVDGRAGLALFLHELGDHDRGLDLLTAELDRAELSEGGLLFPVSDRDRRLMPYLSTGTAGVLVVASRYLATTGDDRVAAAIPGLLTGLHCSFTHYGGLLDGMAGISLALHDHGRRHGDQASLDRAKTLAQRLFLYAVPHRTGTYVPGEHALRLSGDLWFGSAGVLTALAAVLGDHPDPLFALGHPAER
ncbi:class III lanthionine synthetase LanKC [Lentzea sp. NBRC 102530]|uniref:class III lanthionine synthetase LanKC n=1 Tax=Lentzea sp. NBRC 102530 TaxID=3032201 RepID=UPI0024A55AF1|nr:class III lanthionine synthetase LanKC [Lentzea sp. NBRC 102530]GLY54473.1 serine/threonine protein kinase [Lentzea sp. NBRC 102530]